MSIVSFFDSGQCYQIEQRAIQLLNEQPRFMSPQTIQSPRAVGDAVQAILSEHFLAIAEESIFEFEPAFARRSMADFAFTDEAGNRYIVDVKTHRLDTEFSMPNLTSVKRLTAFYESDQNFFCLLLAQYRVEKDRLSFREVHFIPIEFLSWNCLTIGALGWGQIQIANANLIQIDRSISRKAWMLSLCETMMTFYPQEVAKIHQRMNYFEKMKSYWESK